MDWLRHSGHACSPDVDSPVCAAWAQALLWIRGRAAEATSQLRYLHQVFLEMAAAPAWPPPAGSPEGMERDSVHRSRYITEGIKHFASAVDTRVMKVNLSRAFPISGVFTLRRASRQLCFRETGPLGGESWECLPRQGVSVSIQSDILIL